VAPPGWRQARVAGTLRGGSGLDGGSGARGYPRSTTQPGSTTVISRRDVPRRARVHTAPEASRLQPEPAARTVAG
jgi:hypothetical protein